MAAPSASDSFGSVDPEMTTRLGWRPFSLRRAAAPSCTPLHTAPASISAGARSSMARSICDSFEVRSWSITPCWPAPTRLNWTLAGADSTQLAMADRAATSAPDSSMGSDVSTTNTTPMGVLGSGSTDWISAGSPFSVSVRPSTSPAAPV